MLSALGYIGIGLMGVSVILFLTGRKDEARKVRKFARYISWTRRGIRVTMAAVTFVSGIGMTGYDLVNGRCGDNESLRPAAVVEQLAASNAFLAQEDEDGEEGESQDDEGDDESCDDD